MIQFSHNVGSNEYAGKCKCGASLHTYPDYEKPFKARGSQETFYLEALQHTQGVVVRCGVCNSFGIQPLEEWGVTLETA